MQNAFRIGSATAMLLLCISTTDAHEWHRHGTHHHTTAQSSDGDSSPQDAQPVKLKTKSRFLMTGYSISDASESADIAKYFEKFSNVKTRSDGRRLYIECNAIPDHDMMVGIKSWQQQVPIPQPFTGDNAWSIPLKPELSDNPISVRRNPLRGAIAIAVNGVPIFCALNNRGEDAYLLGELDKWGGHCGRGDDYHYHIAPVHLEEVVGKGNPIAFALDGFPIYGYTEADGSSVGKLDQYNGQFDGDGQYHYHATKKFPYINGGLRGVVTMQGDQIQQPRDAPVRPGMPPLRGATITAFETNGDERELTYRVNGGTAKIVYSPVGSNGWKFTYTDTRGQSATETFQRNSQQNGRRGGGPPPGGDRPPRPGRGNRAGRFPGKAR